MVCVSLLYSWQVRRTTETEFADNVRHQDVLEEQTTPVITRESVDTVGVASVLEFHQTADGTEEADISTMDTATDVPDMVDALFPTDDVSTEVSEDVPVSPYGFGPYPEIPAGYPLAGSVPWLWTEEDFARIENDPGYQDMRMLRGISFRDEMIIYELMSRVGIKLWNEGHRFDGITTLDQTGRFYPNEPDVLYVEWQETELPNGEMRRYMSGTIGSAVSGLSIAAQEGREPLPDWIEIRSMDEGIDPYQFLGLSR